MPIVPNFTERLMLLKLNQAPGPMLDFLGAQAFRVLCVAGRLGVFEALRHGPLTAAEAAWQVGADEWGTRLLLEALVALGYVQREGDGYTNTPMTVKWLLRNSPTSLADGLPFFESMVFDRWQHLDESIRCGRPAVYGFEWLDQQPGRYRAYEEGMLAVARMSADEVVAKVRLRSTTHRLLDVGGGHGWYTIGFCHRYPNLSATVFDLPPALEVAREIIAAEGMGNRVTVHEGNFWTDELGADYDVVLLFNIVHAHSPDQNTELLCKVASVLNPGGLIVILDQTISESSGSIAKALIRLQALNYFNDLGAQTYTFEEIANWLTKASFSNVSRVNLLKTPGFGLVIGISIFADLTIEGGRVAA